MGSVILVTRDAASWRIPSIRTEKKLSPSISLVVVQIDKNLISQNAIVLFKQDTQRPPSCTHYYRKDSSFYGELQYKVSAKKGKGSKVTIMGYFTPPSPISSPPRHLFFSPSNYFSFSRSTDSKMNVCRDKNLWVLLTVFC